MIRETVSDRTDAGVITERDVLPMTLALLVGGFFCMLNETLLNVALNQFMGIFRVDAVRVQWLTTGYMLVMGILIPISSFLMRRFKTRRLFLFSLSIFLIGTILAACSATFSTLLLARLIQAVGTGIYCPLIVTVLLLIYPAEKRGAAMGMVGLVMMFAPAIGPTLSGLVLQYFSWRLLFFGVVPFLLFAIAFGFVKMKNVIETTNPTTDICSIALSSVGFGSVIFGLSRSGEAGFFDAAVMAELAIGLASLGLFIRRQRTLETPLLNLRAFRYPMFSLGVVLLFVSMMMIFANTVIVPIYLQGALGLSAFMSGLILLPGGALNGLLSPVSGRFFDKFGPKALVPFGLMLSALSIALLSRLSADSSIAEIVCIEILFQGSLALVVMPIQTNGLNQLPVSLYADGSAIMNTLMQIAGAFGISLFISLMATGQRAYAGGADHPAETARQVLALVSGVQYAFGAAFVMVGIGFALSLFLKRVHAPGVRDGSER